ncbi:MAG: hypothetical protein GFH27_549333n7 [Chloroflexi bacterium AL-W]|nr:hypothetical protein [Chloroflexi bacterium AL-N1]NOK70540.1 hypothetical protein [Chloroflexi bacterium AL-N10]NOK78101.1 hypothetical protein [Chloroflexi bacterium AL-N5]NOK85200.1 hypothetical protein [Chloroflexi bacterium AL-W]
MHLTRKTSVLLFISTVVALCFVELWVVTAPAFPPNTALFAAIVTADLLVGVPLLFYALVVRPYRLSPTTIAPIFLLAFMLARFILPPTDRQYLDMASFLLVLVELTVLSVLLWRARRIAQHYQQVRPQSIYFSDALESSISVGVGNHPAIKLFMIEFVLLFLALFGWFLNYHTFDSHAKVFTYHRKSLYPIVFLVFLLLMIFETIGLHLLIQHWSSLVAWILTTASIYGLLWMIGEFNALRLLPIVLADETLHLRSGFRWSATVRLMDIVDIHRPKRNAIKFPDYLSFARAAEPQMVLVLKHPVRVFGLFGREKEVSHIGLFLDDVNTFRAALDQRRQAIQSKAP